MTLEGWDRGRFDAAGRLEIVADGSAIRPQRSGGAGQGGAPEAESGGRPVKKEPILNVSLDRVWVEEEVVAPGTIKRSFFQERDERLERVYKHPVRPKWRLALWCQEDHNGRRCDTFLGQVFGTSEGDLWEARIRGLDQRDLAFQKMASPRAKKTKLRRELHAYHQWLDDSDDPLIAHCPQHGSIAMDRNVVADALSEDKKHLHRRGGRLVFS